MLIDECGEFITRTLARYALILTNGTILKGTIDDKLILKVIPLLKTVLKDIPVGKVFTKSAPWIFFRASEHVIIILATRARETVYTALLEMFHQQFGQRLAERYSILPYTFNELIKFNIFAIARQNGPEPIAWSVAPGIQMGEDQLWKYAVTSMMVLINEVAGAKTRILNFHPFINEGYLGVVYLFQIPLPEARGGAFDSLILSMMNIEDRVLAYENNDALENIYSIAADEFVSLFQAQYGQNVQSPIVDRSPFSGIISDLNERLKIISLASKKSENIRSEMFKSLKDLAKMLKDM